MKKLRIQPSFASLSEDELEQLACMIQRETFAVALGRARKPRSEGGFGLTLRSESPLERLLDKKNKLDLINARLCLECADHKKLTLADLNSITAGEIRAPMGLSGSDVHDAIMSATYNLVTEHDNTPHQLLALQRLADFPARAELREQTAAIRAERLQIARSKEQRAEAKAQREAEMHTHKIQLDLRKLDLKLEMAQFQKQITTARLDLREKQHADRPSSPSPLRGEMGSSTSDQFEPTSDSNLDRSPSRRKDNSTRPKIRILVDEDGEPFTRFPSPNPLPHEIYLKNCAYTKKLLAGLVDPLTGRVLDAPSSVDPVSRADAKNETSPSRDKTNDTNAQAGLDLCASRTSSEQFTLPSGPSSRDEINPTGTQVGPVSPSGPLSRDEINPANAAPADLYPTHVEESETLSTLNACVQSTQAPTRTDVLSTPETPAPESQNSKLTIQNSASAEARTSSEQFTLPSGPSSRDEINPTDAQVGPVSPSGPLSRDEIHPTDAAPADPNATNIQNSSAPADPKSAISNQKSEIDLTPAPETHNSKLTIQNSSSSVPSPSVLLSPAELAAAVDRYTVNRAREHVAYEQKITAWPHSYSPPEYITQFRHCPCGHPCPCPVHESEEFGPFLERFWKVSPFNFLYRDSLRDRNLPYREPTEFTA